MCHIMVLLCDTARIVSASEKRVAPLNTTVYL